MEKSGLLLVNKPEGITSHDLVLEARRALGVSKIGHTGTLDPLATGVMILTVGKTTKLLPYIVNHDKEYVAVLKLGIQTDSDDITGAVIRECEPESFCLEQIKETLDSFVGTSLQTPPMYSAKKVNGRKLYELARKNVEIEREPVEIIIREMELLEYNGDEIRFRCRCSSGTYIRVLCHDIAERLGTCGCMSSLCRTAIDRFTIDECCSLEQLRNGEFDLVNPITALGQYLKAEFDDLTDIYNGKRMEIECDEELVFITHQGSLIAVYEREEGNVFACRRGLW